MPNSNASERAYVSTQITKQQRDEWKQYAEDNPNIDSLSHLLRLAVTKEIQSDNNSSSNTANTDAIESQLSEVLESIQELDSRIHEANSRLDGVERQLTNSAPEVKELANRVFEILPTEAELIADTHQPVIDADDEHSSGRVVQTGRIDHLATHLGVEEVRVGEALQKLQEDTALINTRSINNETRYFKEV